jgi:hypothetical protein
MKAFFCGMKKFSFIFFYSIVNEIHKLGGECKTQMSIQLSFERSLCLLYLLQSDLK